MSAATLPGLIDTPVAARQAGGYDFPERVGPDLDGPDGVAAVLEERVLRQ